MHFLKLKNAVGMHAQISKFGADVFLFLGQPASQIGSCCYSFAKEEFESSKVKKRAAPEVGMPR